jgi:multidrug efflux pump subunit AcrA (membrane-fusion protein)
VIVPKGAVASREGRDVVFVVQAGRVERRAVTVASTVGTDTTLAAGLAANERIVVDPPAEIADGVRVEEKKL